ncbi:MAG TPA: FAD-dependent oxidoreductase, partial [Candidatus Marinimicrobia bacterium]|nr:FAD-dependent oxidoreductase [Candidatus Neomarinimicrobiota bacterium]
MTKIGEKYSQKLAEENFDAIIIGSGMSGLSTAAFLSKAGKKVLVLERHFKVGGWTHTFQRGQYEWDVGIHYIGAVGRKNAFLRKLFDEITDERLEWASMSDNYDRMIFPDKSYNFVAGKEQFIDQMVEYFPKERDAIVKYLDLVKQCTSASTKFFMNRA